MNNFFDIQVNDRSLICNFLSGLKNRELNALRGVNHSIKELIDGNNVYRDPFDKIKNSFKIKINDLEKFQKEFYIHWTKGTKSFFSHSITCFAGDKIKNFFCRTFSSINNEIEFQNLLAFKIEQTNKDIEELKKLCRSEEFMMSLFEVQNVWNSDEDLFPCA